MLKKSFQIDKKIYDTKYISLALEELKDFFDISFDSEKYLIDINGENDLDIFNTFSEFMNYVLGLQIENL